MEITLGKMPGEHTAKAETKNATSENDVPHLGLTLAPATDVAGAGGKGVVVVAVDPDGLAADHGLKTGDVILDIGGKSVDNVSEVRKAMSDAHASGRHDVLMRVKTGNGTRFVALPIAKAA